VTGTLLLSRNGEAAGDHFGYSAAGHADACGSILIGARLADFGGVDSGSVYVCSVDASWRNYGNGFPGRYGIPSFTSRGPPALGSTVTLDLGNSMGLTTTAFVLLGFQKANVTLRWGGEILVVPASILTVPLPASGTTLSGGLPSDPALWGLEIDLQALELDFWAARNISLTAGLELILGL
jgi:hypothetical protein